MTTAKVPPLLPDAPPPPAPSLRQVNYWAVSIFSTRTFWVNAITFLAAASSMTEFTSVIPEKHLPKLFAVVALGNLWLRMNTVRPVAFIKPGKTKAVLVPRIDPPTPAKLGD